MNETQKLPSYVSPLAGSTQLNFTKSSLSSLHRLALVGLAALLLLLTLGLAEASAQSMGVAVNKNSPVTPLDKGELKKIFGARKVSWGSTRLVLVLMPKGSPEMKWLCSTVLGMPESAYRRHLLEKVFKGKISKPLQASSVDHALMLLAANKGAIAPLPLKSIEGASTILKRVYK